MTQATKWLSGLSVLLGLWLVFVPFIYDYGTAAAWNTSIAGLLIAAIAGYNYSRTLGGLEVGRTASLVNILLSLWLLISPFIIEEANAGVQMLPAFLVLIFEAYDEYVAYSPTRHTRHID